MALKFQHAKVHPAPPKVPFPPSSHSNNDNGGGVIGKSSRWLCKKTKRKQPEDNDDESYQSKKPKTWRVKLKEKSGGIYLTIHQTLCLILFCSLEARITFEKFVFPDLLIPLVAGFLLLLSQILVLVTIMMDPGVQPRKSKEHQQLEINYYNTHRVGPTPVLRPMTYYGETILGYYCYDCKHFMHPRTRHCDVCDRCIVRYDHHCGVLGTCVGIRNYPFYFYHMIVVLLYYLYITTISTLILIRKLVEDTPTFSEVIQNVSILWVVIISMVGLIVRDGGHLLLFPCVYLYITARDRTAKELFCVIEKGNSHNYKCYTVVKTRQEDKPQGCFQILKNLRKYLCVPIPPSLLKHTNYYVVCDLDEIVIREDPKDNENGSKNCNRPILDVEADLLLFLKENEQLEIASQDSQANIMLSTLKK